MTSSRSSTGLNLNSPRAIFLGWTALVFVAGFGYYTVKSSNTQKKKEFMMKQAQEGGQAATTYTPGNNEKFQRSPLQSLTDAFSRQTDQRSKQ